MAFHLAPDPGDPGEPRVQTGLGGGEAQEERRLLRDGAQILAHGALVCPECDLPLAPRGRFRAAGTMRCAYCEHAAVAREFVRKDVFDTVGNEVYLVARVS